MAFFSWSRTASSNASADATINWAEGQSPSSVNDSARAMMARTAEYRDDVAGAITTGGSSTAYTVTSFQVFDSLAHLSGQAIAFVPHATNTNAVGVDVTLSVDGLGAKPVRQQPSVALPNGSLILGTPFIVVYNNSDSVFYLRNMTNPYSIPLGGMLPFIGSSSPNSSFVLPFGQAISRTTYSTLFTMVSTTYGVGDGSTTFNLPDFRGRIAAGKDDMGGSAASRLTTAGSSIDGTTLGSTGGAQNVTIAQANLPNIVPTFTGSAGTATSTNANVGVNVTTANSGPNSGGAITGNAANQLLSSFTPAGTISSINGNVTQTVMNNMPPALVVNYILRVI